MAIQDLKEQIARLPEQPGVYIYSNTAGDTITSVGLVLTGDTTAKTIQIAFDDAAPATCSDAGAYDGSTSTTSRAAP